MQMLLALLTYTEYGTHQMNWKDKTNVLALAHFSNRCSIFARR